MSASLMVLAHRECDQTSYQSQQGMVLTDDWTCSDTARQQTELLIQLAETDPCHQCQKPMTKLHLSRHPHPK